MSARMWRVALLGLGGVYLALAAWAGAHARSFTLVLANFGPINEHLVRDFAACAATFGLGLVIADRVPSWRTPALTLAAVWNGFHAITHIVDMGDAQPAIVGPIEAALLIGVTFLLGWLASTSARSTQPSRSPKSEGAPG